MLTPPAEVAAVLTAFCSLFTRPSWRRAQALLCGALFAPGNHVLTAALRVMGLATDAHFQNHHRLLNRARWSAREAAGVLLKLLVAAFVPTGPLILGLDETVERRRGPKIQARAISRDAARSSRACFQKTSGLRWLSLHLLVHQQPGWQASVRQAAWDQKALPTFSDALAQVRCCLWRQLAFCMSQEQTDSRKPPDDLFDHLGEMLAYAA